MKICHVSDPLSFQAQEAHPMGPQARVLLTSVFGPYAQDDEYGSRTVNPMECYHNQVTRVQGPFSLRMTHPSLGLYLIMANVDAPCTLLDFPDLNRFEQELREKKYDIIGISAKSPNVVKVAKMCAVIRARQPGATIVVGGHIANMSDLGERIDADYVVCGEGVRWFRKFLGQDPEQPISHPCVLSGTNARCMGINLSDKSRDSAAALIPSVGCPIGCNFCSTSAMFGGKGRFVCFYETGDELFDVMCKIEKEMGVWSFFAMDENFLLNRRRSLRLLELIQAHGKSWALYVFSSADVLASYDVEQLVGLGISWVWVGLEGKNSHYEKLRGIDTQSLTRELQANGIRVLGSTMIGLEEDSPDNIDEVIDWAVGHATDFHQFMLYTPAPGTPLYADYGQRGMLLKESEVEWADTHGQSRFNYRHGRIQKGQDTEFLLTAFQRDFEANGPSVTRMMRTLLNGWLKYKNHPQAHIRKRFAMQVDKMPTLYAATLWATRLWFKNNPPVAGKMAGLLNDIYNEFGMKSRIAAPLLGRIVLHLIRKEQKRLDAGWAYEPPTFYVTSIKSVRPRGQFLQKQ